MIAHADVIQIGAQSCELGLRKPIDYLRSMTLEITGQYSLP
jgi:hypothetical protein